MTPAHYDDLDAVESTAWTMLADGVADRHAAFHQMALATTAAEGRAAVRTVVLRGVDPVARTLRFHTDRRSTKFAELSADPRCEAQVYDHGAKVQLRLRGTATLHAGNDLAAGLWVDMRDFSRACYRQPVGPSAAIAAPGAAQDGGTLQDEAGAANFVAVTIAIEALEWLYLAATGHRRALLCYGSRPGRTWLAP